MNGDTFALGKERARILNISAPESLYSRCGWELSMELKGPFLWAAQYMGILSWNCCPRPKFFWSYVASAFSLDSPGETLHAAISHIRLCQAR
jgi:hypothetical protein